MQQHVLSLFPGQHPQTRRLNFWHWHTHRQKEVSKGEIERQNVCAIEMRKRGKNLPRIVFAAKDGGSNYYRHELLLQQPQLLGVFPILRILLWRGLRNEALRVRVKRTGEIFNFCCCLFFQQTYATNPLGLFVTLRQCLEQEIQLVQQEVGFLWFWYLFLMRSLNHFHWYVISLPVCLSILYKRWIIFAAGRIFKYAKNSNMIRSFVIWYSNFFSKENFSKKKKT